MKHWSWGCVKVVTLLSFFASYYNLTWEEKRVEFLGKETVWRPRIGYVAFHQQQHWAAVDQLRRKLAGDRYRCWISDNEHRRRSGQGTWNWRQRRRRRKKGEKGWEIEVGGLRLRTGFPPKQQLVTRAGRWAEHPPVASRPPPWKELNIFTLTFSSHWRAFWSYCRWSNCNWQWVQRSEQRKLNS